MGWRERRRWRPLESISWDEQGAEGRRKRILTCGPPACLQAGPTWKGVVLSSEFLICDVLMYLFAKVFFCKTLQSNHLHSLYASLV